MDTHADRLWLEAFSDLLGRSHLFQPDELAPAVAAVMSPLGCRTSIYLVDEEQRALRLIPPAGAPVPLEEFPAGEVFRLVRSVAAKDGGGWWVPMVNGTDRLGVVEFSFAGGVDAGDELLRKRCETMAGLVGHLITVTEPKGDFLRQARRLRPMSSGAELITQMLPPLTVSCERLVLSAILEPRYNVGGDGFDYALDGPFARMSIFDAVGHGLKAGLACTVTLAAVRAARRAGQDLFEQARAADAALLEQFDDARFVTGILAELNMETGRLRYLNAGHPWPILLRDGKVLRELPGGRRLPLGLNDARARIGEELLEPGDQLLFYTDGVTEARDPAGDMFGVSRLIEQLERHAAAGLPAPETLRQLAHAVATHHDGPYVDDATLMLAHWSSAAAQRSLP